MSYDYDGLVNQALLNRRQYRNLILQGQEKDGSQPEQKQEQQQQEEEEAEQEEGQEGNVIDIINSTILGSLTAFETLSNHCPMTVLLWMKYSQTMYWFCCFNNQGGTNGTDTENSNINNNNNDDAWKMRLQILELGLLEFPGSSLLHCYYLDLLCQYVTKICTTSNDDTDNETIIHSVYIAFDNAFNSIGKGSHRNEDDCIILLYQLYRSFVLQQQQLQSQSQHEQNEDASYRMNILVNSFKRQSRVPMKTVNDTIQQQVYDFFVTYSTLTNTTTSDEMVLVLQKQIEVNRVWVSKLYSNRFINIENEIETFMKRDKIWVPWNIIINGHNNTIIDWDTQLLLDDNDYSKTLGMGYGSIETANAYIRYARSLLTYHIPKHSSLNKTSSDHQDNNDDEQLMQQLGWCVYERGIVECPTIETIWLSYIRSLTDMIVSLSTKPDNDNNTNTNNNHPNDTLNNNNNNNKNTILILCQKLQSICPRAVRNCPYSVKLVQQQINVQFYLAEYNIIVLDQQLVFQLIDTAMGNNFITPISHVFDLYITAIRVIKRRIGSLLCKLDYPNINTDTVSKVPKGKDKGRNVTTTPLKHHFEYDDLEPFDIKQEKKNNKNKNSNKTRNGPVVPSSLSDLNDTNKAIVCEIEDLADDLLEMFDEIDSRLATLQQQTSSMSKTKKTKLEQQQQQEEEEEVEKDGGSGTGAMTIPVITTLDRALLLKERSSTISLLLNGIINNDDDDDCDDNDDGSNNNKDINSTTEQTKLDIQLALDEKMIRSHNPPHPDFYAKYIQQYIHNISISYIRTKKNTNDNDKLVTVVSNLRRIRFLYDKALSSVGNPYSVSANKVKRQKKNDAASVVIPSISLSSTIPLREYTISLNCLCMEWIEFERMFGSDRSIQRAEKAIKKKFEKIQGLTNTTSNSTATTTTTTTNTNINQQSTEETVTAISLDDSVEAIDSLVQANAESSTSKRPLSQDDEPTYSSSLPQSKKARTDVDIQEIENKGSHTTGTSNLQTAATVSKSQKQNSLPKVKVGNLEYPAHPYTVRVSHLRHDVCDMDLVDALRPKCGAIVHARIVREKSDHHHHQANAHKGWGLVQFEERESVAKALELNDTISIHEKLIVIERSHIPAVSLVPPGMHRISPVGTGKVSKRNEKARQQRQQPPRDVQQGDHSVKDTVSVPLSTGQSKQILDKEQERIVTTTTKATNLLAFRPRAIARVPGGTRKQPKLSIDRSVVNAPKERES